MAIGRLLGVRALLQDALGRHTGQIARPLPRLDRVILTEVDCPVSCVDDGEFAAMDVNSPSGYLMMPRERVDRSDRCIDAGPSLV
jgi:hypothetical protein